MAEILAKLQVLQRLPTGLHWFCELDDAASATEDGLSVKREISTPEDTAQRRDLVFECLQIFAYDGDDVVPHQEYLKRQIDEQLGKCDICIRSYYKAKRRAMEKLQDDYDDQEVAAFFKIFDDRDVDRIKGGLENATRTLRNTAPEKRGKEALETAALLSIFEALSCEAFLTNHELVRQHLDEPFKLVQSNKRLQVTSYVPAATNFLFDPDHSRCFWALQTWSKYPVRPTKDDFDFAIRDPLLRNLILASGPVADPNFVQRLWCGMRLVVDKLDKDLITHSLRAMEVDVFRLALEHLQHDTAGLRFLLQTMQRFLEISPEDFWDSMGAISPTTVVEQVFNNPQYDRFVMDAKADEKYEFSALKDMLSWVQPFMASLQTVHQPAACRSLAFQFMDRLQADRFPNFAKIECYQVGLGVLSWTLTNCNKEKTIFDAVGRIVAAETLDVVSKYIKRVLAIPSLPRDDEYRERLAEHCLRVIKSALALECKSLRTDQEALQEDKILPHGFTSYSPAIWDAVVHKLDRGNIILAKAALVGINDLTGLEKFKTKTPENHYKEKSEFNVTYGHLTHLVCQMLERINDFDPEDLDRLFRHPETATALVASLFSADANTYEAGINLIKSISSESARKEAIGHLLTTFFETTLNSFSWSVRRIAQKRTFASCPRMLKTCADVLDILCDAQDGLLRTRTLSTTAEIKAVEHFWEHQWDALKVIYEMTEAWSRQGKNESAVMKEFCRDTMQFSERFFDQYSIFASAIDSAVLPKQEDGTGENRGREAGKELLRHPARIMESMVKWLRLRDEFLASTSVKLVQKVLGRLTEWKMTLTEAPCSFLELVIQGSPQGKTKLTPQEKAKLARALEDNLGRAIIIVDTDLEHSDSSRAQSVESGRSQSVKGQRVVPPSGLAKKTRLGTIDLEAWGAKAKASQEVIDIADEDEYGDSDIPDDDILSASRSVEMLKEQQAKRGSSTVLALAGSRKTALPIKPEFKGIKSAKSEAQLQAERTSFREKREREREAKRRRDAEQLARLKKNLPLRGVAEQTSGEGSALGSIGGVRGKDHAPQGPSMMVSSGSESESGDELDHELFGGAARAPKVSNAVKDYQASKLQQARAQGPVKKTRQVRSAKDMRARLAPDLSSLHKTILGWDFFHEGDFPPNSDRDDYSLVTSTFRTPMEYQNTFEPLLVLEAWQGFLKSKEEGNFKPFEIKVANRLTVDSFVEVSTAMSMADGKELGVSEADIILMSKGQSPAMDARQPHCLARVLRITRKKNVMDISYRVNVGNDLLSAMVPNSTVYGVKVSSITPLEREYGALLGLKYYDLCDEIVKAKPSPLLKYSDRQLDPVVANYKVNKAQAKAVRSALDNDAFTLIQGPPGSGKTKTIVAIVGALLTSSLRDSTKGVAVARPQLTDGNSQRLSMPSTSKKLLVCAPSNAAVDELVMRFKDGVKTIDGEFHKLSIVRLGRSDAINTNVIDVTLEELVNAKLNLANGKKTSSGEDIHKIMMEHKATSEDLNNVRAKLDEVKGKGELVPPELEREFDLLKRKKQQLSTKIDAVRDSGNTAARDAEISRRRVQQEVIDGAHVICATLSGSGHEMFQSLSIEFETVIIDEAAQSIELSALIPLKYGCSRCILVGDPKQLPPTVLSREAARFQYEQSLFVRMQTNHPSDVHLLDTQYRMHPEISLFPSKAFYDGRLLDGPNMANLRKQPWHESKILGPYRFFDVQGTHQSAPRGHSLINVAELEVALQLFDRLITDCKGYDFKGKVGIITPYKSQLRELRSRFAQRYGDGIFSTVEFNTTDAFQGRESEIIIFSCVRASPNRGIGFLADIRRMNVGLTRAKSSLWVLGNSQSLMQGEFWGGLIQDARTRDRYTGGDLLGMLRKPMLNLTLKSPVDAVASRKVSNVVEDMEMPDAPILGSPPDFPRRPSDLPRRPSTKQVLVDVSMDEVSSGTIASPESPTDEMFKETKPQPYRPSGGANGLNNKAVCDLCGSSIHFTTNCDREDVKLAVFGKCHRCGGAGHTKAKCVTDRCLECGVFGHTSKTCTSITPLARKEKERVSRQEAEHRSALQRLPQKERKWQMGDHEAKVPTIRESRKTPPPGGEGKTVKNINAPTQGKRKRELSPPLGAPKGPKMMAPTAQSSNGNGLNHARPNGFPPSSANVPHHSQKPPRHNSSQAPPVPQTATLPAHHSLPPKPTFAQPAAPAALGSITNAVRDPPAATGSASSAPPPPPTAVRPPSQNPTRPHPQALNPVRPPKPGRKKDASPFIVPKKKRP